MTDALKTWMRERDTAEWFLYCDTPIPGYWRRMREEAEQEIERILRA